MENYVPGKLRSFFSKYKTISYKKNQTILRPEDKPQGVYYIKEGFVKLNTIFENGRELTLNIFKPGTYFPMMWVIAGIPNSYFFQAQTDTIIHRAPKSVVLTYLKENPDVLFELTRRILVGLDGVLANIEYMLCGNAHKRVIGAIYLSAKRFGERVQDGKIAINLPLTHQDIANIAGISRETASLALMKLVNKKIISCEHHTFIINSMKKLEKEGLIISKEKQQAYAA
ncbi:hypothetical protein A2865_00220 [Candidatus Woesebacteria bacterium RIFCSPHIGHO2_01_FULL_39_17]|uniref:Crp/Fnr family protein n=3 Tax=Candidatus Woeseibacteriota TaxID=1752722 RepID=A0A0G0NFK3_9BACT|nr:MAG: Crp/Fnr family protein [Microgenomates group bacterium GW2011_GWC1_38_12]KKQ94209.1 MAG: Crp/Fnr family protein [Candidatus Woesebacteria bacterium GW2011_GWB1_39_10b]KKR14273.1 MAG: Crp/Fnr family protein [Candidatus Woesebacteria bacterium GW2011_GWA1_39_21b]OGM23657.1 MAG: hypothetical protein A2865_00220 [Candidatus Woesebacteria bacterium RIFCSPHIGHO2_01_FULL_39_17]OGM65479.1 MAG: hypothetical protein A3A52_00960 [Candidatus Woesebacteria bacterium RIFCSPLOWO2_01_FULL_39_14]